MNHIIKLTTFFSILFFLSVPILVKGQDDFMDLLLLFVDEKYDVCFHKSLKYNEKEKTKKHPLPYLYAAMSSFEMSQDHKYTNMYPKAYKTALSYLGKYRKKDKGYEYREDAEDFTEKIKMIVAEDIENYIEQATETTYGKAAGFAKKICSIDPDDYGCKLLYGHLCILTKNRSTAKEYMKPSIDYIKSLSQDKFAFKNMTHSQQHYLKFAIINLAAYQKNKNITDARETLELGKDYFYTQRDDCLLEDNKDFISIYDEIFSN